MQWPTLLEAQSNTTRTSSSCSNNCLIRSHRRHTFLCWSTSVHLWLHQLKHSILDERSEALKALRSLGPKGVVLCENNGECSRSIDFAAGFSKKLDYLWMFWIQKAQDSKKRIVKKGSEWKKRRQSC
ncbi:unnamed protein product [Arabidopsis thaliana]|uniref:Uncharacterized protein n=1 Tax=Arabidopsis thaliana TaxID=3702 RepID=Q9LVJ6_ARATH|nr:unnamed protein product [Arabidopsis thaliana]